MAGFDFGAARAAGYSDDEIVDYLRSQPDPSFDVQGALDAGYTSKDILQHLTTKPDTSYLGALRHGVASVVEGAGKTLKDTVAPDAGKATEAVGASMEPKGYQPAFDRLMHPQDGDTSVIGYGVGALPRVATEAAPGILQDVMAAKLAGKVGGIFGTPGRILGTVAGATGSYMLRNLGSTAETRAANRTGDPNAAPNASDVGVATLASAAEGAVGTLPAARLAFPAKVASTGLRGVAETAARVAGTSGIEGGTAALQNAADQAATTAGTPGGLKVDPREVGGAALTGAAAAGAIGLPRALVHDIPNASRFREFGTSDMAEPSAAVANRLAERAGGTDALSNPRTAFDAVKSVHQDVLNELGPRANELRKTGTLSPDADNAIARATRGERLTPQELETIRSVGDDGLTGLAHQSDVMHALKEHGQFDTGRGTFTGGLASAARGFAQQHPYLSMNAALGGTALHIAPFAGMGLFSGAAAAAPALAASAAGIGGTWAALRALDKATGRRSPAQTFTGKFADPSVPVRAAPSPDAPAPGGLARPPAGLKDLLAAEVRTQNRDARDERQQTRQDQRQNVLRTMPLLRKLAEQGKEEAYNPRSDLMIDEGIAGITGNIQKAAQQQHVLRAQQALRKLAAQSKAAPEAPAAEVGPAYAGGVPPSVLKDGRGLLSALSRVDALRPKDAPAAAAPEAPAAGPAFVGGVAPDVLKQSRGLMDALSKVSALKEATQGRDRVAELLKQSPFIEQTVGSPEAVANPTVGKEASRAISSARAQAKLASDPAAEADAKAQAAAEKEAQRQAARDERAQQSAEERARRDAQRSQEKAAKAAAVAERAKVRAEAIVAREAAKQTKAAAKPAKAAPAAAPAPAPAPEPIVVPKAPPELPAMARAMKPPSDDGLDIPEFLRRTPTNGKANGNGKSPVSQAMSLEETFDQPTPQERAAAAEKSSFEPNRSGIGHLTPREVTDRAIADMRSRGKTFAVSEAKFREGAEYRDGIKVTVADKLAKAAPELGSREDVLDMLRGERSKEAAKQLREHFASIAPSKANAITRIFDDKVIDDVWTRKGNRR